MDVPSHLSANELRVVRRLLWTEITQQLNLAEQDEVKKRLDWALITENESLMSEADALAEILGEVQVKTSVILDRQRLCTNPTRSLVRITMYGAPI
jgi:regulator of replication initiation timing